MDLLDRLLAHDAWTTQKLLDICADLNDSDLDSEFDIGHRSIRRTLDHVIRNMEVWSALMAEQSLESDDDRSIAGMSRRLAAAAFQLKTVAQSVADQDAWDELWVDHLDDPPTAKRFGTAIAHVITHSMHHRAQILYMLRLVGAPNLPEGDLFSWESESRHGS